MQASFKFPTDFTFLSIFPTLIVKINLFIYKIIIVKLILQHTLYYHGGVLKCFLNCYFLKLGNWKGRGWATIV